MKTQCTYSLLQPIDQFVWMLETASNHFRVSGWLWNFILTLLKTSNTLGLYRTKKFSKTLKAVSQVTAQKIVGSLPVLFLKPSGSFRFWNSGINPWIFDFDFFQKPRTSGSLIPKYFKKLELVVINKSHIYPPTQHYCRHINLNLFFWGQVVKSNEGFITCEFEMLFASFNLGVGWGMLVYICFLMNRVNYL
jgi:hypothetical protein